MKIYQPAKNSIPKFLGVFAILFGGGGFLLPGITSGSIGFLTAGLIITAIGVITFFGKAEKFIDTEKGAVINFKKWLFIESETQISLSLYKYVRVIENSDGPSTDDRSRRFYEVNLVGKNTTNDYSGGFDINMLLAKYPRSSDGKSEALSFAEKVAREVGLPMHAEKNF
ncbi:hypothetical protein M0G74_18065 [Microbulbifer sp. CAU 1566]|uniref:hypothetical protein n=1 Tax=Microbulbifer sp. CAU 1566 TaxID=2933269 RepID=UPI0020057DC0|nr:hypothetical protein [Microbulbifer sp. CAU 1566]MCK7599184.1 hypothetical protein [Microbulbifer sp. CAU 1566]